MVANWYKRFRCGHTLNVVLAFLSLLLGSLAATAQTTSAPATATAPATSAATKKAKAPAAAWKKNDKILAHVTPESVKAEIDLIYSFGPRAVGQTGHARVREYIKSELTKAGYTGDLAPFEQKFAVTVPVDVRKESDGTIADRNATLTIGGQTMRPIAMYPNAVAPSYIGGNGVTAPIIDGKDGGLTSLNGKTIRNAIVLLDYNSDKNWENAAKFGAAAVLFRHPKDTTTIESAKKFFNVPLEMPRYLLDAKDTAALEALLAAGGEVRGNLKGGNTWQRVETSNIMALIPGSDPDPAKGSGLLILSVYLDSMCVAPAAPHGADSSLQLVAGLNVARALIADPAARPNCSVLIVFFDAQHQALAGARELTYLFTRFRTDKRQDIVGSELSGLEAEAKDAATRIDAFRQSLTFLTDRSIKLSPAARKESLERMRELTTRGSMNTARRLQDWQRRVIDAANLTPQEVGAKQREKDESVAYLRRVRDWYADLREQTDPGAKLAVIEKGVDPAGTPAPIVAQNADLLLKIADIRATIEGLFTDLQHEVDASESDLAAARRIFGYRISNADGSIEVTRRNARLQNVFLEVAPGGDQFSWAGATGYGLNTGIQSVFPNMQARHQPVAQAIARELKFSQSEPLDDAFSIEATTARGNYVAPIVSNSAPLHYAGLPVMGLSTINQARSYVDTPIDDPAHVDIPKAYESLKFLCAFVPYLASDLNAITNREDLRRNQLTQITGRVVRFDLLAGVTPNQQVPGAMAYFPMQYMTGVRGNERTTAGVRFNLVSMTDNFGRYRFASIANASGVRTKKDTAVLGFRVDADGRIDFATDQSTEGTERFNNRTLRTNPVEDVMVVIAPMRGIAVFDLIDPRTLTALSEVKVMNAISLNRPENFSIFFPMHINENVGGPFMENSGVVFAPPHARIVALTSAGFEGVRAPFLNLQPAGVDRYGSPVFAREGFDVATTRRIEFTALQVAQDISRANDERLLKLSKWGIRNNLLEDLTTKARNSVDTARKHYEAGNYAEAYREATHAWGVGLRAYKPVKDLGKDAVIGSVFFLALVLPFSFFLERLLVRAKNPNMRILWTVIIFIGIFLVLFFLHPAFSISLSPLIVLLAFVMLVLVAVVFTIVYRKFVNLIKNYRNQLEGVHGADLKRFSAGGVALNLSLSTMARRKARTLLTAATLTMLAFAIVTFSSITSSIAYRTNPIPNVTPNYSGLMFRMPAWANLPSSVVDSFRDEFGEDHTVLPRTWTLRSQNPWSQGVSGNMTILVRKPQVASAASTKPGKVKDLIAPINGIVGATAGEAKVLNLKEALAAGRWLEKPGEAVIPESVAAYLQITKDDLDTPRANIFIREQGARVVGILKSDTEPGHVVLDKWRDLDGENFAPADFSAAGVVGDSAADLGNLQNIDPNQKMPHISFDRTIFMHISNTLLMRDTEYKGVAVAFKEGTDAQKAYERLMLRLKIPIFAALPGATDTPPRAALFESTDSAGFKGFGKLVVPILLAVFMIVNTLLGTVEERKDEIGMLNSVGLAPAHVGMLFLVEAIVYGVIGLVVGYMGGLLLAKVLLGNEAILRALGAQAMSLNYSSSSTIISCILVLIIVVLSALYPARQAKRMATPGTLTRWSLPESDTGEISIEVPFTLTGGNALGMIGFLDEYLAQHRDATSPDFRVMHKFFRESTDADGTQELVLAGDAYLAPYDLGVSNTFEIRVRATAEPNILRVRFAISRLGGDMSSYRRATQKFLDLLRRQFLIWRTLEPHEKAKYVNVALTGFGAAPLVTSQTTDSNVKTV